MDERLLVKRAKRGDTAAFAELYGTIYKRLYQFALYTLGNTQDAEDVVSDTIVAAFESIGKLRDVYRFRQWLFKILSNQCKKRRKSYAERNRRHNLDFPGEEQKDVFSGVSDGRDMEKEATDREWIRQAFETLSEEERYIVNSFLFGGYRGDEIAQSLGIGSGTLRSKYRRALAKMKKKLDE